MQSILSTHCAGITRALQPSLTRSRVCYPFRTIHNDKTTKFSIPEEFRDWQPLINEWKGMEPLQMELLSKNNSTKTRIALSHVRGTKENNPDLEPLIDKTISAFLDEQVEKYGDKELLRVVHQDIRWSWSQFQKEVDSLALGFLRLGLRPGDTVGVWMPNNKEWITAQFATAKAGLILININPAYRTSELEHALNLVTCKALLIVPSFKHSDYIHMLHEIAPELEEAKPGIINSKKLPSLRHIIQNTKKHIPGMHRYDDILVRSTVSIDEMVELRTIGKRISVDDPVNVQFTSGTTGLPKGATLTHKNILNNGYFIGNRMKLTEKDSLCVPVPLYHCFGLVIGNLAAMTHGAKLIYPSAGFDATAVLETIHNEKCTALHGVPTMFIAELEHPNFKNYDLSSLRTGVMAGSTCPIELMKRVMKDMHMKDITICYGMTETSPVSFQTETDSPEIKRVETVGRIHPHTEGKIVDEQGRTLPVGSVGELWTKGYIVMKGYWNNENQTKESIEDGWMKTGDLAVMDQDGYVSIVGRKKDMLIRGGENVYPREVEEFLLKHPSIEQVEVIGVPDEKYGEQVCAWIKIRNGNTLTEQDVKDFCHEKIAHYKIPHYILFVDSFPMTISGKIQKNIMREQTVKKLFGK